jgi:hypothetical protein
VDPLLSDWMILEDIPPFLHSKLIQRFKAGGAGFYGGSFLMDDDAQNIRAETSYRDEARNMGASVEVRRQAQARYVDHFVESGFRSEARKGRFSPNMQMLVVSGEVVYLFCENSPNCMSRSYAWLSGNDTGVEVGANCGTWAPDSTGEDQYVKQPCPEPTEILQAYLERYPSSLSFYVDDASQAERWFAREAEFQMAVAKYELDRTTDGGGAPINLTRFARIRGEQLNGPAAGPQMSRIAALDTLPADVKREQLIAIWDEYHVWWVANQGAPVELYVAPTPTPVVTPPTPDPTP